MNTSWTLIIAVWGAITGTLALVLELKRFRKESPVLSVAPRFDFMRCYVPPSAGLKVEVANHGHRTTTVDFVLVRFFPEHWWQVPLRYLRRERAVALNRSPLGVTIDPRKAHTFVFDQFALGRDIVPHRIREVLVRDQTGQTWRSRGGFGQRRLRGRYNPKLVRSERVSGGERKPHVEIKLFSCGRTYLLTQTAGDYALGHLRQETTCEEFARLSRANLRFDEWLKEASRRVGGGAPALQP